MNANNTLNLDRLFEIVAERVREIVRESGLDMAQADATIAGVVDDVINPMWINRGEVYEALVAAMLARGGVRTARDNVYGPRIPCPLHDCGQSRGEPRFLELHVLNHVGWKPNVAEELLHYALLKAGTVQAVRSILGIADTPAESVHETANSWPMTDRERRTLTITAACALALIVAMIVVALSGVRLASTAGTAAVGQIAEMPCECPAR